MGRSSAMRHGVKSEEKDRYLSQLLGKDWSKGSIFLLLFEQLSSMIDVTI